MRSFPKVSVIVPAFNEEKYITRALEALMSQDYPNFEIIVADNASTDKTSICIQQFAESLSSENSIITSVYESRRGTNFARECARKVATGSIIAQMDADCIPSPNWLRKGVSILCSSKNIAVTGPYNYFDGNRWMRGFSLLSQQLIYPLIDTLVQLSGRAAILIGGNAFIRADVLEKAGGYNTDLTFYGDDVELGKRLAAFGRIVYAPSLVQSSSSRRYKANGFWKVNQKYQSCFWDLVWNRNQLLTKIENSHPR